MSPSTSGPQASEIDYAAKFKEIESHPLFMRDIPTDLESNEHLEALQSLIYDDTPDSAYGFFSSVSEKLAFELHLMYAPS